jgi:hypothetical protein
VLVSPAALRSFPLTVLLALLGCACSSGGSGTSTATVAPTLVITPANVEDVAAFAIDSSTAFIPPARVIADLIAPGDNPLIADPPPPVPGTEMLPGPLGGTVTQTWEDRDGDEEISTGDEFVDTFASYRATYATLSGTILLDRLEVVGRPIDGGGTFTIAGRMTFLNVSVTVGGTSSPWSGTRSSMTSK